MIYIVICCHSIDGSRGDKKLTKQVVTLSSLAYDLWLRLALLYLCGRVKTQ